ncbi:Amino Acid/Auxin Permease (AAAP) Family [Achlya hypogyna]|uniref:Amino Acid/Auxin Permease (AAAP) Family n=1 Tax=Achlya hypogyna TaxID=1202772 RepID=A0A1V9YXM3_ACHHY|nr:Amino Acid/Auxin Permease (AAAP) Family [Achlya hypogyna]
MESKWPFTVWFWSLSDRQSRPEDDNEPSWRNSVIQLRKPVVLAQAIFILSKLGPKLILNLTFAFTFAMAFLTVEDMKMAFSLFCCVYGIGTLGMPGNYARAGYAWASVALVFMAAVNTYATWCISKVMLVAPKNVLTLGDIGEWSMGGFGRWAVVISQMLVCTMIPIVFLVLGGSLLTTLFPDTYNATTWIVFMGVVLLPVCLIPTLKEGAGAAAAGCIGTLVADAVALYLLVTNVNKSNDGLSTPSPDLTFKGVTTVFGNLALAYGAGIVIPALQREHSDPTRMPRIILVTMTFISLCFLAVSITGVSAVGCQIPGNLLFAVAGTKLGFNASRGGVVIAFLFMQLHITIAFAVIMFPAFFIAERLIFGFHKHSFEVLDEAAAYHDVEAIQEEKKPEVHEGPDMTASYNIPGNYRKAALLRIVIVAICTGIAIAWQDHFGDLLDFVGASSTATCCMILPIVFYLKTFHATISLPEKLFAYVSVLVSIFLAIYVSITTGKALFAPDDKDPSIIFPFCSGDYQKMVYTNTTYFNHKRALYGY